MANQKADKDDDKKDAKDKPGADSIMSHQEMKPILNVAYNHPVHCALALTDDDEAVLLLHRKTAPKKLRNNLKDDAEEKGIKLATKVFFGHIKVSPSNTVTITVNREPPSRPRHANGPPRLRPPERPKSPPAPPGARKFHRP